MVRLLRLVFMVVFVAAACDTGESAAPRPSIGTICFLLNAAEIQAALPSAPSPGPGEEGTAGAIRSCHWGALELNVGHYQDLLDEAPSSYGSGTERTIDGLGTTAAGSADAVRVSLWVQTDRGAFSLVASAFQGVTIDRLISLARIVIDRI